MLSRRDGSKRPVTWAQVPDTDAGGGIGVWVSLSSGRSFGQPQLWGNWSGDDVQDVRTLNRVG